MIAIPVIIGAGFLAQVPLAKLSKNHHKEASIRNGILIEAISNPETVKAYQGEAGFQRLWEEYNQLLVKNSIKQRSLGSSLTYLATSVQQLSYVFVIVAGVYLVQAGSISVGGLIAASILSSRTIAPLGQLSAIFARWQQMKTSLTGLNKVMQLPVDRPRGASSSPAPPLKALMNSSKRNSPMARTRRRFSTFRSLRSRAATLSRYSATTVPASRPS